MTVPQLASAIDWQTRGASTALFRVRQLGYEVVSKTETGERVYKIAASQAIGGDDKKGRFRVSFVCAHRLVTLSTVVTGRAGAPVVRRRRQQPRASGEGRSPESPIVLASMRWRQVLNVL